MHVGRVEVLDGSYKYGEKERGGVVKNTIYVLVGVWPKYVLS